MKIDRLKLELHNNVLTKKKKNLYNVNVLKKSRI